MSFQKTLSLVIFGEVPEPVSSVLFRSWALMGTCHDDFPGFSTLRGLQPFPLSSWKFMKDLYKVKGIEAGERCAAFNYPLVN